MAIDPTITVALVGLAGTVLGALFGNWDKIFSGKKTVTAEYSGYTPTGDFATEFRVYAALTGQKANLEQVFGQVVRGNFAALPAEAQEDPAVRAEFDGILRKAPDFVSRLMEEGIPVFAKYFSLAQLQELNKFYSTKAMQEMREKTPYVMQEMAELGRTVAENYFTGTALPPAASPGPSAPLPQPSGAIPPLP